MTVDIRAKVICRIGNTQATVISGGWSDDHVQGTGLIRTRGELIVQGLFRPTLGQKVDLAYVQKGIASRMPRSLRALGAFADPFRNQTTIQLGCVLTLRENLTASEPQDKTADTWDDPANSGIICSEFEQVPVSISAAYVASKCAEKLGINVPGGFPLTNWFTVDTFDLTPGYATVLSDLLVSESYVGYLDAAENLQIRSLSNFTGTMTVIDPTQVIDISSINSGDIPGDAVSASYTYNRYKNQQEELTEDQIKYRDWEKEETVGPETTVVISHDMGVYIKTFTPETVAITTYDKLDRVLKRVETTRTHVAETNQSYIRWYSSIDAPFQDVVDYKVTITTYEYEYDARQLAEIPTPPPGSCVLLYGDIRFFDPDRDNKILLQTVETYQSEMALAGALGIVEYSGKEFGEEDPEHVVDIWAYHPQAAVVPGYANILTELTVVSYEQDAKSGITKTTTVRQQAKGFTQAGNQVSASEALASNSESSVAALVYSAQALVNLGTVVETRTDRQYGVQRRPSSTQRKTSSQQKSQLESFTDITFAIGNQSSGSITRYSVPYSSDDRVVGRGTVLASDAPIKAAAYARAQNRLAFGHRNGFSIQLAATKIPAYPLDRLRISGAGTAAAYICNGTSWSFDSNGIVCNTDALFIGGIGTTQLGGSLWFPVQPGITLLGPAPEVYENEYPQPANSVEVGEEFDPLDPPPTFWDEDLPEDTPAIPEQETEIDQIVPPWREEIRQVFTAKTVIDVTRLDAVVPMQQITTLTTKTAVSVVQIPRRLVSIPVRTVSSVQQVLPAIRAAQVEMFNMYTFAVNVF